MDQISINEGNIKIYGFFKGDVYFWKDNKYDYVGIINQDNKICELWCVDLLEYHISWDWLIPVCKKIIDMYHDNRQYIFEGLESCNIDFTWKAVIDFIDFWNHPESKIYVWANTKLPYDPMPKGELVHFTLPNGPFVEKITK